MDRTLCSICGRAKLPQLQAALSGHVECLMQTLDRDGLLDRRGRWEALATDDFGATALHLAARRNRIDCLRCLVKHAHVVESVRAHNGASALHDSAATGSLECMRYLAAHSRNSVLDRDNNGSTPLHWAVQAGKLDAVVWLVEGAEAPVDARTNTGVTPVHFAAAKGQLKILRFLTGYEKARTGHMRAVDMQANNGATPLYFASQEGNLDCLRYLVEKCQADPDTAASDGMRCVHAAAQEGHLSCLKYLISQAGQSAKQKSSDGATPGHFASAQGHVKILRWLLECTDVTGEERDNYGGTLAHDAAEQGSIKSLQYLVEQGISIHRQDDDGNTPLSLAEENQHYNCAEFLKNAIDLQHRPKAEIKRIHQLDSLLPAEGGREEEMTDSHEDMVVEEPLETVTEEEKREAMEKMQELSSKRRKQKEAEEEQARFLREEEKRQAFQRMIEDEAEERQRQELERWQENERQRQEVEVERKKQEMKALQVLREHREQVASEREAHIKAKRKRSLEIIQSGTALQRIIEANRRDEHVSSIRRKEQEEREKWRKQEKQGQTRRGSDMQEEDEDVDFAEMDSSPTSEYIESGELTAAQKKAEKERRKAENKEKNRTWKKFKLKRRSSDKDKHQRSQSEPAIALDGDDGPLGDNVSEKTSLHKGSESLTRQRVLSEGTGVQGKGYVKKRKTQFEHRQADTDRTVKRFLNWRRKSSKRDKDEQDGEVSAHVPPAPPAPAVEDLLPSGAVTPTSPMSPTLLSPSSPQFKELDAAGAKKQRSLASRLGYSISNLAASMSSLLTIGSAPVSPKPSRSVSFSELTGDASYSELAADSGLPSTLGEDRSAIGAISVSSRSHHSSTSADPDELDEIDGSGIPHSMQLRLSETFSGLSPTEQHDRLKMQKQSSRASLEEMLFAASVEEKEKASVLASAPNTNASMSSSPPKRVLNENSPENCKTKFVKGAEITLEEALQLALSSGGNCQTTSDVTFPVADMPAVPHVSDQPLLSPVRLSWNEEKFPGEPAEFLAALEKALANADQTEAAKWLQSPRNRLSPPDDIHDSFMQMMLAPRDRTPSQLLSQLAGTNQENRHGPPPPPLRRPMSLPLGSDGVSDDSDTGIPLPPPPPAHVPSPQELMAPERQLKMLDTIEEATEEEEKREELEMRKLYNEDAPERHQRRAEAKERWRKHHEKLAAEKRLKEELAAGRQEEDRRQQNLVNLMRQEQQSRRTRRQLAKSPMEGILRSVEARPRQLTRTVTPMPSSMQKQLDQNVTKPYSRPSVTEITARYHRARLRRMFRSWRLYIQHRNIMILQLHNFMEKRARMLMLRCFLAWIEFRNTARHTRIVERRAEEHWRMQLLRKTLNAWCTVCGIADQSQYRQQLQRTINQLAKNRDAYLSWLNARLVGTRKAGNLSTDLADGILVFQALQYTSGQHGPRLVMKPRLPVQKIDNWRAVLHFMEQIGISKVSVQLQGLVDGDEYWTQKVLSHIISWQQSSQWR